MHSVTIDPALPVNRSDLGQNKTLGVKVIDSRPSNLISKWKGSFNFRSFRIAPNEDLGAVLHKKIDTGLQIMGFTPKHFSAQQTRTLTVEILQLKSIYHANNPYLGIKARSALRVNCNNRTLAYKMDYSERLSRKPIARTSFPNETLVNAALSGALKKMFSDNRLLNCLAE